MSIKVLRINRFNWKWCRLRYKTNNQWFKSYSMRSLWRTRKRKKSILSWSVKSNIILRTKRNWRSDSISNSRWQLSRRRWMQTEWSKSEFFYWTYLIFFSLQLRQEMILRQIIDRIKLQTVLKAKSDVQKAFYVLHSNQKRLNQIQKEE